jgi:NADP-dependent 3-hydroxy acid dehydrogenase YdfG
MNFSAKMLRDNALSDKVIVVTGGGSGLGKAMTKYFMELGAKVAITSRDIEKLKSNSLRTRKRNRRKMSAYIV